MKKPEQTVSLLFGINPPKILQSPYKTNSLANGSTILGIEIEVENCRQEQEEYLNLVYPAFNVTTDGSLRGRAFEFISQPMELASLLPELTRFYKATKFTEDNFTDRCSVHVHANVVDMTAQNLSVLCLTYQTIEDILFDFVGHDRDSNIYCVPWNQCRMNYRLIEGLVVSPNIKVKQWQKYTALNLLPIQRQGTVEFRHLHGTADLDKLTTWLSIISNLIIYSKQTNLKDVISTIKDLNNSSQYQHYFDSIFKGTLPYNAEHRQLLERGIIDAKYSLMDFNPDSPVVAKNKTATATPTMEELLDTIRFNAQIRRAEATIQAERQAVVRRGRIIGAAPTIQEPVNAAVQPALGTNLTNIAANYAANWIFTDAEGNPPILRTQPNQERERN